MRAGDGAVEQQSCGPQGAVAGRGKDHLSGLQRRDRGREVLAGEPDRSRTFTAASKGRGEPALGRWFEENDCQVAGGTSRAS